MNLFNLFSRRLKEQQSQERKEEGGAAEFEIYSGMRVEGSTFDDSSCLMEEE